MKYFRYGMVLFVALVVVMWFVFRMLTIYVPVGMVGVRTVEYPVLGKTGIVEKDFGPGWHRDLGPVDSWLLFDTTVQTLEMTRDPSRGARREVDDLRVKSADGNRVSLDLTVKYRITEGMTFKLYQDSGIDSKYHTIVRTESESICMDEFGKMVTEDFYNPAKRRTAQKHIVENLTASLEDNYVEVVDVLIRDVQFDNEYEKKIRSKKLADQEVELNKSQAIAEEMKGKTQLIEAETKRKVKIIKQELESKLAVMQSQTEKEVAIINSKAKLDAQKRKADADLIAAKNEADGKLLLKKAEAEGEKLRNEAMQGVGGSTIVALEAARNLNLGDVTISTMETDLLDLDKMATKLGVADKDSK